MFMSRARLGLRARLVSRARLAVLLVLALAAPVLAGCASPPYLPPRAAPPPPVSPPSVEHRSDFVDAPDGTTLFEQWWRPADGRVRAVVVVVHGLKDHSSRYEELAERLVARNIAVHAFDLRGHGHSAGVRVGVARFEDYLSDLDLVVRRARARDPGAPLFLFGHSMGGAIATLWTLGRGPDLAGLVLSGAALRAGVSPVKAEATRVVAALAPSAPVFQLDLALFSRDPQVVDACRRDPLVYQPPAPAHTAAVLLDAIDAIDAGMEGMRAPLLVMHGAADRVTDPEGSRELVARAASRDKTLVLWPGLVHDLVHEPERAQVLGAIVSWIDARAPAQ